MRTLWLRANDGDDVNEKNCSWRETLIHAGWKQRLTFISGRAAKVVLFFIVNIEVWCVRWVAFFLKFSSIWILDNKKLFQRNCKNRYRQLTYNINLFYFSSDLKNWKGSVCSLCNFIESLTVIKIEKGSTCFKTCKNTSTNLFIGSWMLFIKTSVVSLRIFQFLYRLLPIKLNKGLNESFQFWIGSKIKKSYIVCNFFFLVGDI